MRAVFVQSCLTRTRVVPKFPGLEEARPGAGSAFFGSIMPEMVPRWTSQDGEMLVAVPSSSRTWPSSGFWPGADRRVLAPASPARRPQGGRVERAGDAVVLCCRIGGGENRVRTGTIARRVGLRAARKANGFSV